MNPDHPPSARAVAAVQAATVAVLLVTALLVSCTAHATNATIGRTWPIFEPDALAEIEARVAALPPGMGPRFGPRARWSALRSTPLGTARADLVRYVIPFHRLEAAIRLPDGRTLYPEGYGFNPLAYVTLPQRLVVVGPRDLDWALGAARPDDMILLAGRARDGADVITLSERAGRALFLLEERVKARLGLTVAPVIVSQVGQRLELREIGPETLRRARRPNGGGSSQP